MDKRKCERLSKASIDLVKRLLEWNPANRISIIEVSNHLWLNTPVVNIL